MHMTDFKTAVCNALSHDVWNDSDAQLTIHSQDSSIFKREPTGVIYPRSVDDVKTIVKLAGEHGVTLSVRAGGTCMSGGSLTDGYILNLTKHITGIHVNAYSKSAEVEMGAYYRDLEKELIKHNLMFAAYPSSKDICGLGGMIGNNTSGEKSVRHGGTLDNVYSVDVVLRDGELYTFEEMHDDAFKKLTKEKTVLGTICKELLAIYTKHHVAYNHAVGEVKKAASAYRLEHIHDAKKKTWNLAKLFIGAQATLGIVVKARLKLVPVHVHTRMLVMPIHDLEKLPEVLQIVMAHNPSSVETFDKHTYRHAKKFLPEDTLIIQSLFKPQTEFIVIAEFSEDTQVKTDAVAHTAMKALEHLHEEVLYCTDVRFVTSVWNVRRSSFRVMRDATFDNPHKRAVPCIEDIIVPVSHFDRFIPRLIELLKRYNIDYGFHGHIGDGALRVIPVFDFTHKDIALALISEFMSDAFALIKEMRGNMSADHSDGLIRTPFLREFYGDELYEGVVVGVKNVFDPKGVFNAGKKVGVTTREWEGWVR